MGFILWIFIPAGKLGKRPPLDVGVNRPCKVFWEEKYLVWRKNLNEKDKTKSGYQRGPTRQEILDISFCWSKITPECIESTFVKEDILSKEDLTRVLEVEWFSNGDKNCNKGLTGRFF